VVYLSSFVGRYVAYIVLKDSSWEVWAENDPMIGLLVSDLWQVRVLS